MTKPFAPEWPRNEQGWIEFPDDVKLRREVFLSRVAHPAKNNLYMLRSIVEAYTEPGAVVLDPMAGGGSTMWATPADRHIRLIELGRNYQEMLAVNRRGFPDKDIIIFMGSCLKILPWPEVVDLIMFSPPYSNQLKAGGKGMPQYEYEKDSSGYVGLEEYTDDPDNLGTLTEFWFNQKMLEVYRVCYQSLKPGGIMVFVLKDQIKDGQRVDYTLTNIRKAVQVGFKLHEWHKHTHTGKLFGTFNLKQGYKQITDEDIVAMRKE